MSENVQQADGMDVICERRGRMGLITLNRPRALNALSLAMVRTLTATLLAWERDPLVDAVALRGMGKEGPFGAFCAGGDIRFFHQAALAGNPELEDFFTEEYALNHLVHRYAKPYVVFMDGIVMGGGMGIAGHGGVRSLRIATERTKMAMPETNIGLFPDVGGGWFLGRCPGALGDYLALTGQVIGGEDALAATLADGVLPAGELAATWEALASGGLPAVEALRGALAGAGQARQGGDTAGGLAARREVIDRCFAAPSVPAIVQALEAEPGDWARETIAALRKRSPLMLHVVREQLHRARSLSLADALRMERDMVRRCFHLRPGAASETVEGIRALAVDKDHAPRWNPPRIEDVTPAMWAPFFQSPWPPHAHPLRDLH
ncbi:enoyl-CoA hydratase/isomerase family protein [Ramlibacter sp. AN1015]|uniref:enoyl-CoA hydratase/isomerase family protein n=1 Tax=Ramlibacter sp. AN1015 TaxID=3133428 RepID=UPI0030BD7ED5